MTRQAQFRIAIRKFDPFETAIQRQWSDFEASARSGLQLDAQGLDLHPLTESLFEKRGLLDGDWDVAFINTDWAASIHAARSVVDLAPYIAQNPPPDYPQGWTDSLLRLQNFNGYILGLPYHDGPECLIYRKDLFTDPVEQRAYEERFGVPLEAPVTWEQFMQVARFFHRPHKGLYGTAVAAYPDGHNTVYDFLLQLWTRGGDLADPAGGLRCNSAAAAEGLTFYRSLLHDNEAIHPASVQMDSVRLGLAFAAGEVAMMVNWFGFATMAETIASSKVNGRVGIAVIPHGVHGHSTSLNIYWFLAIAAGSPHRDLAYRFLAHCARPEMDKLLTLEGGTGCRKSTWKDRDVNRIVPFYRDLEAFHATAREMPQLAEWPEIGAAINDLVTQTIGTRRPISDLLREADLRIASVVPGGHVRA
jgi:multiple sugar transport system substrate-binding protein